MRIAALLQAFALFVSLFTLLLMVGVRVLRKQDLDTFLRQQEHERVLRRMAQDAAAGSCRETPPSLG